MLVFKTNPIAPGSSESFSFVYVTSIPDFTKAMENLNSFSITQPPGELNQCDRSQVVLSVTIAGTFSSATVEFSIMCNGAIESGLTQTVTSPVAPGTKTYVITQDWTNFGKLFGCHSTILSFLINIILIFLSSFLPLFNFRFFRRREFSSSSKSNSGKQGLF